MLYHLFQWEMIRRRSTSYTILWNHLSRQSWQANGSICDCSSTRTHFPQTMHLTFMRATAKMPQACTTGKILQTISTMSRTDPRDLTSPGTIQSMKWSIFQAKIDPFRVRVRIWACFGALGILGSDASLTVQLVEKRMHWIHTKLVTFICQNLFCAISTAFKVSQK